MAQSMYDRHFKNSPGRPISCLNYLSPSLPNYLPNKLRNFLFLKIIHSCKIFFKSYPLGLFSRAIFPLISSTLYAFSMAAWREVLKNKQIPSGSSKKASNAATDVSSFHTSPSHQGFPGALAIFGLQNYNSSLCLHHHAVIKKKKKS